MTTAPSWAFSPVPRQSKLFRGKSSVRLLHPLQIKKQRASLLYLCDRKDSKEVSLQRTQIHVFSSIQSEAHSTSLSHQLMKVNCCTWHASYHVSFLPGSFYQYSKSYNIKIGFWLDSPEISQKHPEEVGPSLSSEVHSVFTISPAFLMCQWPCGFPRYACCLIPGDRDWTRNSQERCSGNATCEFWDHCGLQQILWSFLHLILILTHGHSSVTRVGFPILPPPHNQSQVFLNKTKPPATTHPSTSQYLKKQNDY